MLKHLKQQTHLKHLNTRKRARDSSPCGPGGRCDLEAPLYANYPSDIGAALKTRPLRGVLTSGSTSSRPHCGNESEGSTSRPRPVCWLVTMWIRAASNPSMLCAANRSRPIPRSRKWMEAELAARRFAYSGASRSDCAFRPQVNCSYLIIHCSYVATGAT